MAFPGDFPENQQSPPMYKTLVPESPKIDKRIKARKFSDCLYTTTYFVHHICIGFIAEKPNSLTSNSKISSICIHLSMWFSCKYAKPFVLFITTGLLLQVSKTRLFFLKLQQTWRNVAGIEFTTGLILDASEPSKLGAEEADWKHRAAVVSQYQN